MARWLIGAAFCQAVLTHAGPYPAHWWTPVPEDQKAVWEILPQAAKPGEVILSKRNELGILSNFAATPFTFHGKRYASVEGFWQMMLYPDGPHDPRAEAPGIVWAHTRAEVARMTAFAAKDAGTLAEANMQKMGIDWVTFEGRRMPYRSKERGAHYRLIVAAMRAKLEQNPKVRAILLRTGDLILRPDHTEEPDPPPEWLYFNIWMEIRSGSWRTRAGLEARPTGYTGLEMKHATYGLCGLCLCAGALAAQSPKYPDFPSETPAKFTDSTDSFDYIKRDVMIPMRDGVKLHTVILLPKGAHGAPILLTRTPYDAAGMTSHAHSSHLGPILEGYDNATDLIVQGGYIRVVQDVRGKYGSEGDYVMNRPLHGPQNPTPVDHATDTYDTIDWLVKNIPESNGKVGILGISYDGFLPLMALVNPHPALKVSVPMNPMVDGWRGDDWFHNGAFRQLTNMDYILDQEATRGSDTKWWTSYYDDYDTYMEGVSAGEVGRRHGLEQVGFWRKILEHPSYDAFWRDQAVDRVLAAQPLIVPVMLVDSLWDQEDIYGAMAVYKAIKPKDTGNNKVFLVLGPWHHGQEIGDGSTLGPLHFGSDTGLYFRREILRPFLDQYLKDGAPQADVPPVSAFETGTNAWLRLPAWPAGCASGCAIRPAPLYLTAGLKLSLAPPGQGGTEFEEYVSDPAKPAPFRTRPIGDEKRKTWSQWLVDDQREASGRPDVLAFVSDVLSAPVKISGEPVANLMASTSGTDSDWVVKLIDVYPDEVASQAALGGYQLMVSADIFRGRYRESLETAKPIAAGEPLRYRFNLPTANHVFLPGHRMMVQVQSSWFPLYDRNPQTFVPNIFWAKPGDYRKAVQRVYHAPGRESYVELPVVER